MYSSEVYLCKISGLKLHKILKLWINEPLTIFLHHPVYKIRSASWESSNGVYLMGGDFSDTKTTLLLPDDSCQPGFDLAYPITG